MSPIRNIRILFSLIAEFGDEFFDVRDLHRKCHRWLQESNPPGYRFTRHRGAATSFFTVLVFRGADATLSVSESDKSWGQTWRLSDTLGPKESIISIRIRYGIILFFSRSNSPTWELNFNHLLAKLVEVIGLTRVFTGYNYCQRILKTMGNQLMTEEPYSIGLMPWNTGCE